MSSTPAPASRAKPTLPILLATLVLAGTSWQTVRLLVVLCRHIGTVAGWLEAVVALPILVMFVVGAMALLRGDRRRGHWIWIAALVSLFRSPIPDLATSFGFHVAFPVQRLVNPVIAVLAVVACRRLAIGSELEPSRRHPRLWAAALVVGLLALLIGRFTITIFYVNHVAAELLHQGNDAFEQGRADEAIALWTQVRADYPNTRAEGMALFNASHAYQKQGRWTEAIPLLEKLLAGDLNDTDPNRELMNPYQNYHNRACLGLMTCHEELGDHRAALRYALLARDVYPHRSLCGTCLMGARQSLNRKIARLEAKVAGREPPDDRQANHEMHEE